MTVGPPERQPREKVVNSIQARVRVITDGQDGRVADADVLDYSVGGFGLLLSSSFSVEMGDLLEVDLPAEIDSGSRHRVKVVWVKPHSLFAEVGVMKVAD